MDNLEAELRNVETFNDATRILLDIRYELADVAKALRIVGMDKLSDRLFACSRDINEAREVINKSLALELNGKVKAAMESSDNMLKALLVGASLNDSEA